MILDTWEEKIISVSSTKDPRIVISGDRTSGDRTNKDVQVRVDLQRVPFEIQPKRQFLRRLRPQNYSHCI